MTDFINRLHNISERSQIVKKCFNNLELGVNTLLTIKVLKRIIKTDLQ